MKLGSIGYNHIHDKNFVIDRRDSGADNWLFLLIKTPAVFIDEDGKEVYTKSNSFIIYKAHTPHYYRTLGDSYINDWFHFYVNDEEEKLFDRLHIPINTIVQLDNMNTYELSFLIHIMTYDFYISDFYNDEMIEHYLQIFFLKLSRLLISKKNVSSRIYSEKNDKLISVRYKIQNEPSNLPTIEDMAKELYLSKSGFQHIYKKVFGISVMQDVINSRISLAKKLLATTNLTIAEIAFQCGYKNECSFMRQFKENCDMTPSDFRKTL